MTRQKEFKRPASFSQRRAHLRPYRKRFVISAEGQTELQYFEALNRLCDNVVLKPIKGRTQSAPAYVLKRMQQYIQRERPEGTDECWLVVDRNDWPENQLKKLEQWSASSERYGFAISNPKFEFWLLLHFENGTGVRSPADCTRRLRNYIPEYDGSIGGNMFTTNRICDAVKRAKDLDNIHDKNWPFERFNSTVYRLVSRIIRDEDFCGNSDS